MDNLLNIHHILQNDVSIFSNMERLIQTLSNHNVYDTDIKNVNSLFNMHFLLLDLNILQNLFLSQNFTDCNVSLAKTEYRKIRNFT